MIPNPKIIEIGNEAQDRYLAALATTGLDNKRHQSFKNEVKNKHVTEKKDIIPKSLIELLKTVEG